MGTDPRRSERMGKFFMKGANPPNYPILIALGYWHGDQAAMLSLVKLIVGMQDQHAGRSCAFMLTARRDTNIDSEAVDRLASRFNVFTHKSVRFDTGWPSGSNGIFGSTMIEIALKRRDSDCVFWMEPDCVPLRKDWHQVLAAAWKTRQPGKLILGHKLSIDGRPEGMHINGCALYDTQIARKMPGLTSAGLGAWDWQHRVGIVKNGQDTPVIRLYYKHENAPKNFIEGFKANAPAVVHGFKDRSLLELAAKKFSVKNI